MAENEDGNRFNRALSLINEAVTMLKTSPSDTQQTSTIESSSTSSSVCSPSTSSGVSGPSTSSGVSRPTEMLRLFPFLRPPYTRNPTSQNTCKSRPRTTPYQRFKPKESWTHTFVCLAGNNEECVPSRSKKQVLKEAGLGEKKIVFSDKNGSFQCVKNTIESHFPQVKDLDGALEILRSNGARRSLELIPMPPLGYTVPFLKDALGQAIAYIRPVQKSLDITPISQPLESMDLSEAPSVTCSKCEKKVAISMLRSHEASCTGGQCVNVAFGKPSNMMKLKELFPNEKDSTIQTALSSCGDDLNQAATQLAGFVEDDIEYEFPAVIDLDEETEGSSSALINEETDGSHLFDVMKLYKSKIEREVEYVDINRMHISILRQIMRIYKNPKFKLTRSLDVHFQGEQCVDMGGPCKEFFHVAIASFKKVDHMFNIQLFGGLDSHLVPLCGVDQIASGFFEIAGKVVAHSILHDGPGFVGLSPALVKYLSTGSVDEAKNLVSCDDLLDLNLKRLIQQIKNKQGDEIDSDARDMLEERMVRHGLTDVPISNLNKDKAINDILVAEVLITRIAALDAFYKGLNCLGLGDLLCKYPVIVHIVFPSPEEVKIDTELIINKLEQGKQQVEECNETEEQAWQWFLKFVKEDGCCKDENTGYQMTNSLVLFMTGCTIFDPDQELQVLFQTDANKKLLEADSCFNRVIIPTSHRTYEEFAKAINLSVTAGATGYGRF